LAAGARSRRPHAADALLGIAALLATCASDLALLTCLRAVCTLTRRFPTSWARADVQAALPAALRALWEVAEAEQRGLIMRALRRVRRVAAAP
jgi:hypothetical protein